MSRHAICLRKKKPQLVCYSYNWSGNKFYYQYGTSSREFWDYDELPFKVLAELSYDERYSEKFPHREYPVENILKVKLEKDFEITPEEILALKGYKNFFGGKNIKKIEIAHEKA